MTTQLPPVRGRLTHNVPIGKQTWFGVGGPAEVLFRPADTGDLAGFLAAVAPEVPVTVIGTGSNLLVRDGGIPGVTVRLGRGCAAIAIEDDQIRAGGAALDRIVAYAAAEAGLAGLEFLSGIPGAIGGSVRMNAGAYGREVKDALVSVTALDRSGQTHTVGCRALRLSYRHSEIDPGWIIVEARLRGTPGDRAAIAARLDEIRAAREATQPVRARTGGSTFKNPPGEERLAPDRCRRMPRPSLGRREGVGAAHQFSDQHRRSHRSRPRRARRRGQAPRLRDLRANAGVGDRAYRKFGCRGAGRGFVIPAQAGNPERARSRHAAPGPPLSRGRPPPHHHRLAPSCLLSSSPPRKRESRARSISARGPLPPLSRG